MKPKVAPEKPDERKEPQRTIPRREPVKKPAKQPVKEPAHVENFREFYDSKCISTDPVRNYLELSHASEYSGYDGRRCYF